MVQKLHIGTTLAALVLFFLPWIDIQCSQQSIATQTGIQSIYGGGSPTKEMQAFMDDEGQSASRQDDSEDSMGHAPLIGIALLAVVGAVIVSFIAIRSDEPILNTVVGILCAAALVLISAQMAIGFPAKTSLGKAMGEGARTEVSADPMDDFSRGMSTAMMMNFQVRHLPSLYITLVILGIPTLILANGLLDKLKGQKPALNSHFRNP